MLLCHIQKAHTVLSKNLSMYSATPLHLLQAFGFDLSQLPGTLLTSFPSIPNSQLVHPFHFYMQMPIPCFSPCLFSYIVRFPLGVVIYSSVTTPREVEEDLDAANSGAYKEPGK